MNYRIGSTRTTPLLWEFLISLLQDEDSQNIIRWTSTAKKSFKIINSAQVAKLWGEIKSRPKMNQNKLRRAIRLYYKRGIMEKVVGQKGGYKFVNLPYNPLAEQSTAAETSQQLSKHSTNTCMSKTMQKSDNPFKPSYINTTNDPETRSAMTPQATQNPDVKDTIFFQNWIEDDADERLFLYPKMNNQDPSSSLPEACDMQEQNGASIMLKGSNSNGADLCGSWLNSGSSNSSLPGNMVDDGSISEEIANGIFYKDEQTLLEDINIDYFR